LVTGTSKPEVLKKKTKKTEEKQVKDKPAPQVKDSLRQEAHEAIRPTNISLFELPETLDSKERRMYKLIWENTLESCMSPASFYSITASISAIQNMKFIYTSELIDFPGWKIVSKKYANEIKLENKEYQYLQQIKQNSIINYKKVCAKVTIKGSKQHYTEARLVQLLEEKGIGRPSTFSSLIDKIQERGYVKKEDIKGKEIVCKDYELEDGEMFEIETKREFGNEKSKLVIQPLGIIVMEFLDKHFSDLFNYDYTKEMEDELDKISKGSTIWYNLCDTCNKQIDTLVDGLKDETKIEVKIDDNNTYLVGKYGPVIKCVEEVDGKEEITFKPIKKDMDIHKIENGEYNIEEIVDTTKRTKSQYILGQHDGKDVILKKGKFGLYISWGENSKNLKELGNRPIENITFDEVKKYLEEGSNLIREISSSISIRKGTKGDYIFYKSAKMKKPQFFDLKNFYADVKEDYKICNITILKSWINDKYKI
jgi:DNA topoisomerase-1